MIHLKKFLTVIASVFLCIGSVFAATKKESLDHIVSVVNDSVITQSELNDAMKTAKQQFAGHEDALPNEEALNKQVLDQVINRKLQLELAKQSGIHVDDAMLDKAISGIAAQNHITVDELYQKVAEQGLDKTAYRSELREEITLQQIQQQEVGTKITITPQEVDDFIRSKDYIAFNSKEYHLEDILVTVPEAPTPEDIAAAKQHAEMILAKLHQGQDFQSITLSATGDKSVQGGDLGWRKLPEIPPEFANQIVHMKKSELLGPVPAANGFHIVRLSDVRSASMSGDKKALHKQVEDLVYQRKFAEGLQNWLTKIRSQAFISSEPEKIG